MERIGVLKERGRGGGKLVPLVQVMLLGLVAMVFLMEMEG